MKYEFYIKKSGKTLKEIQEETGISHAQLYRIRAGKSEPTASVIIRLCDALGCTADELLGRDKKTPSDDPESVEAKGIEKDGTDKNTL